jgi:hypothetical protein
MTQTKRDRPTPAAAASSSMNDWIANVFAAACPWSVEAEHRGPGGSAARGRRRQRPRVLPGADIADAAGSLSLPRRRSFRRGTVRRLWVARTESTRRLAALVQPPRIAIAIAGPFGPAAAARVHTSRTGRPPAARARSAASSATSSAPLWP